MNNRLLTALAIVGAIGAPLSATSQRAEVKTMKINGHDVSYVDHDTVSGSMKSRFGHMGRFSRTRGNLSIDGGNTYYPYVSLIEPMEGSSIRYYYVDWNRVVEKDKVDASLGGDFAPFLLRDRSQGNRGWLPESYSVIQQPPSHVAGYEKFASDLDPTKVKIPNFSSFVGDEPPAKEPLPDDDSAQPTEFGEVPRPALWSSGDSFNVPGHGPVEIQIGFGGPTVISIDGGKTYYAMKVVKEEKRDHVEYSYLVNWDKQLHPNKPFFEKSSDGYVEFFKRKEYVDVEVDDDIDIINEPPVTIVSEKDAAPGHMKGSQGRMEGTRKTDKDTQVSHLTTYAALATAAAVVVGTAWHQRDRVKGWYKKLRAKIRGTKDEVSAEPDEEEVDDWDRLG